MPGGKAWMAENINYETAAGSKCYSDRPENCEEYGRLYDWAAAKTACPAGWHLPTQAEWDGLTGYSSAPTNASGLMAVEGWEPEPMMNEAISNSDGYGFSALPGGGCVSNVSYTSCATQDIGYAGYWWTSTNRNDYGSGGSAYGCAIAGARLLVSEKQKYASGIYGSQSLLNARCVRD